MRRPRERWRLMTITIMMMGMEVGVGVPVRERLVLRVVGFPRLSCLLRSMVEVVKREEIKIVDMAMMRGGK